MDHSPASAFVFHPRFLDHDTGGDGHPESADRLRAVLRALGSRGLITESTTFFPAPARRRWLRAFHTDDYLYRFEEAALSGRSWLGHPDNQMGYETFAVALLAAGAGILGVDLLASGRARRVFCPVRPPGHHAEPSVPLGFCFFNNCVIAARYWQKQYGMDRILIFDFDAHHGNGIQAAFEEDPDVLYVSIHEHPTFSFPGTGYGEESGEGPGRGLILNCPLPPGSGDRQAKDVVLRKVVPLVEKFRPRAIIIAAGFDGHRQDDMSGLQYSTDLYRFLGEHIRYLAERFCGGRVLSILEGGYHLPSLAAGVLAYVGGLDGKKTRE